MKPTRSILLVTAAAACACITSACVGPPFIDHLAGTPQPTAPFFHHRDVFVEGEDLHVGVDPNRYVSMIGQSYGVYVVVHKTPSQWSADPALVDVTGALETATLGSGTLLNNRHQAWPGMALGAITHQWHRAYDVVFDLNGNGVYDKDTDILDRIGVLERPGAEDGGGFTLVRDPALAGDFPVSTHDYNLGTFVVNVPSAYVEFGDPLTIPLVGRMYYPATSSGVDRPVHTAFASYPVVVIAHGRSSVATSYLGYDYLARHLASRGFIVSSVDLYPLVQGWRIHHRGVTILRHVRELLIDATGDAIITQIRPRMDVTRVGLVGHSRGGEGIVAAQVSWSTAASPGYTLRALAAIAPTDGSIWDDASPASGPYSPRLPFLMIYGSRDGDVSGYAGNQGIRTFDRARRPRHMIFIHGANHNFFNQVWGTDGTPALTRAQQETLARAFITPFLHAHLEDYQAYVELLSGQTVPPSVGGIVTSIDYGDQPQRWIQFTVDDSQDVPAGPSTNSLGQPNTSSGLADFIEESLRYATVPARNYHAHDTDGLRARWLSPGGTVVFHLGTRSARYYDFLNFRVGQRFMPAGSANPTNATQDLIVRFEDADGNMSPDIRVSTYTALQYPDDRGTFTKSVMRTVRIPVRAFTANGSPLDIGRLVRIHFSYDVTASGDLLIDDVEFLGLDVSEPER